MTPFEGYTVAVIVPLLVWICRDERKHRRALRADAARRAIGQRYRPNDAVRRLG